MHKIITSILFIVMFMSFGFIKAHNKTPFVKVTTSPTNLCQHTGWFMGGCSSINTRCKVGVHTYNCWSQDGQNWCCEYECGC